MKGDYIRRVHQPQPLAATTQAVEGTVLSCGGEVWHRDSVPRAGCLENRLEMTVALPYLWGVPPAFDTLSEAIHMGGGVIHKITKQWQLL
mmetsp:Transcript_5747/g.16455  ORF Transcript_5747/g.16455 Transcript_5747/m.16455 type:complete len:90 (+) Transcript_5747:310-579(+)